MTLSNLTVSAPGIAQNTLFLNNAGLATPLQVLNTLTISSRGTVSITNSVMIMELGPQGVGGGITDNGFLLLNTGTLVTTQNVVDVGYLNGSGQITVLDGTWLMGDVYLGDSGVGTLTLAGGTTTQLLPGNGYQINVGVNLGTGTVWLTGGELDSGNVAIGGTGVGTMTVSNGTWNSGNFIFVDGTLTVAGGTVIHGYELLINSTGMVWMTGGQLTETNNSCDVIIGSGGVGQMTVSNGTWLARRVDVGESDYFNGAGQGTLTLAGGASTFLGLLAIAEGSNSVGTIQMTGGQLIATNEPTLLGADYATAGTLTLAGTSRAFFGPLYIAAAPNAVGAVWLTGGQLITTNGPTAIGDYGVGHMTVSNGNWLASEVDVSVGSGSQGTLTVSGGQVVVTNGTGQIVAGGLGVGRMSVVGGSVMAQTVCVGCSAGPEAQLTVSGGSLTVLGNLIVGNCSEDGFGVVEMSGGTLYVTNAAHNAILEVRNGVFELAGGSLVVDKFVATNTCFSLFDHTGGALSVGTLVLDPNGDIDGDGLPNGWKQQYGLDPLDANLANEDPDGDGFTSWEEYEAGTDPTDRSSNPLRITSIVQQGNDVLLTWTTAGGKTNRAQIAAGASGNYSNNFTDLSPVIVPTGSDLTSTNFLDVGGATNRPSRFYRMRLVP